MQIMSKDYQPQRLLPFQAIWSSRLNVLGSVCKRSDPCSIGLERSDCWLAVGDESLVFGARRPTGLPGRKIYIDFPSVLRVVGHIRDGQGCPSVIR